MTDKADVKLLKRAKNPQMKAQLEGFECLFQELRDHDGFAGPSCSGRSSSGVGNGRGSGGCGGQVAPVAVAAALVSTQAAAAASLAEAVARGFHEQRAAAAAFAVVGVRRDPLVVLRQLHARFHGVDAVDARELVFEIVDPSRLRIEALAFDAAIASNIGAATMAVGDKRVPLTFIGASRSLREQALPLVFRAQGDALTLLAVGQPVRVFVQTKDKVKGVSVPVASLMKNPANQTVVWVKTAPERFEPRTVTTEPLDGVNAAITSGLEPGDRVATQGATLINQVR